MWILYAFASAFFAGIMSVLAKIGLKDINSNLATALRTIVVVIFAWLLVFITGANQSIQSIGTKSLVFLILSGLATGGSWLCYFKALQIGDVNKVVPIDKSSTVLTMLLSMIFFGESITIIKLLAMILIGLGTYLMIEKKKTTVTTSSTGHSWLIYAGFSAIFASLTAILGKVGVEGVDSNLATAIRTIVILIMAWGIVVGQGTYKDIITIDKRSWLFILFSGLATGLSWLFYYRALQEGSASVVVPIDKLSILVTIGFSYFALHETLQKKALVGLVMIVVGTMSLLL